MKISIRQVLASVAGAVVAATIASFFGVSGTIVGVAIGSAAATIGTAVVAQSIDRTHTAVRQAVVRAPDTSLLRRLGGTNVAGTVTESVPEADAPVTEAVTSNEVRGDEVPVTEITSPGPRTAVVPEVETPAEVPRQLNWRVVAVTSLIVFVRRPRHHHPGGAGRREAAGRSLRRLAGQRDLDFRRHDEHHATAALDDHNGPVDDQAEHDRRKHDVDDRRFDHDHDDERADHDDHRTNRVDPDVDHGAGRSGLKGRVTSP